VARLAEGFGWGDGPVLGQSGQHRETQVGNEVGRFWKKNRKTIQGLFGLYKTFIIYELFFYFTNYFEFKPNLKSE
jgi:hypothetical protein